MCFASLGSWQRSFDFTGNKIINLPSQCFLPLKYLSSSPGGALGHFLGGYVLPGTPNWHPKKCPLKLIPHSRIRPKTDTPF